MEAELKKDILLIDLNGEILDLFNEVNNVRTEKSKKELGANGFANEIFYHSLWEMGMCAIKEMHGQGKFEKCHKLMELCARLDDGKTYKQGIRIKK